MSFISRSIALTAAYLVAAKVGLIFGTVSSSVTIFWPPGGIALGALLLGGVRYLPAVFTGALLAALMVKAPPLFALGSSLGNTLETFFGYWLITRYGHVDLKLTRPHDLFIILLLGGLISSLISALLGPLGLLASGLITTDLLQGIMWRWWRADVLGIAFFTPLFLIFARKDFFSFPPEIARESFILWVVAFITGQIVLLGWVPPGFSFDHPPALAWIFPLVAWAGLRAGRRNTALIQLMFLTQSILSAHLHTGFFADDFTKYGLANFWIFAMLLGILGMATAIQATQQRKSQQTVALNAKIFSVSLNGILFVDTDNNIVNVNPAFTRITGYTDQEVIGKNPRLLSSGKHGQEFFKAMWTSLEENDYWEGDIWNRRKDGMLFLEKLFIHTIRDPKGRIINRIGIFSDITEQRAAQDAIAYQAQHDYLTGLPNRQLYKDRFDQLLAISRRHAKQFALIYLDLDRFKPINDKLGHQIGDKLLVTVAQRLTQLVRASDTVSRLGGDEFAILVSEIHDPHDVTVMAGKILTALALPFDIEGHTLRISGSLGVAFYPDHGTDMETLMSKADTAMYQAKKNGSNIMIVATTSAEMSQYPLFTTDEETTE